MASRRRASRDVFLNCPFDPSYAPLFRALVFAVHDCGFRARSALEVQDSGQVRIQKIVRLIRASRFGIHDISSTGLDPATGLPRFNMPLELGLFLGASWFGTRDQRRKKCLVLDTERYRYQKFCSDIAGQDIAAHGRDIGSLIRVVRNWMGSLDRRTLIPGGKTVLARFERFKTELPLFAHALQQELSELTHNDYAAIVVRWLRANPW